MIEADLLKDSFVSCAILHPLTLLIAFVATTTLNLGFETRPECSVLGLGDWLEFPPGGPNRMLWTSKTDGDVLNALKNVADYRPEAQDELFRETEKRGLAIDGISPFVVGQIRMRLCSGNDTIPTNTIDVSKASKIRRWAALCPRALIVLGIFQLIFGLGELAKSLDDGSLDTFLGSLYICFGILAFWRIRITAFLTVVTQAVLIPGWLILLIGDTIENGALRNMRPLILTLLGILSFIGSIDILRYVRSLSQEDRAGQRALQSRYFPRIFRPAVLLSVAGSFVSLLAGLVAVLVWVKIQRDRDLIYPWWEVELLWLAGSALFLAAFWLWRFARRRAALTMWEIRSLDTRAAILFLRSFEDDGIVFTGRFARFFAYWAPISRFFRRDVSFEESLVTAASVYGPVLAIGVPGQQLRTIGAAREYASDDDWQKTVRLRMQESAAIFAIIGATEGLSWEIQTVRELGLLGKLVLVVPPLKRDPLLARMDVVGAALPALCNIPHSLVTDSALILSCSEDEPLIVTASGRRESDYAEAIRKAVPAAMRTPPAETALAPPARE